MLRPWRRDSASFSTSAILASEFAELLFQPDFFPVLGCAAAEIGALCARAVVGCSVADAQTREVCVAELGLAARGGCVVAARGPAVVACALDVVVNVGLFEAGAQTRRHAAGHAEAFAALVQDVEEGETGVFAHACAGLGIDEVPGKADVRVRDVVETVEQAGEGLEGDVAVRVAVGRIDLLVLGLVGRRHVPVEAIAQAGRVVVVFDRLEGGLGARQSAVCLDQVGFGLGDEPVGQGPWARRRTRR